MEQHIQAILHELEVSGSENDTRETDRRKKCLNLEPDTAELLSILVRSGKRTRVLEVGTSNGYSTIWLAWSVAQTGGHITSIELLPEKRAMADENLRRVGLRDKATLLLGDATEQIEQLGGQFDLVFLDADRTHYSELFTHLLPRLTPDALVLADNVHSHPDEIAPYLKAIEASGEFDHIVIGIGKGLSVAYRKR